MSIMIVSIALGSYNGALHLEDQLTSIFEQTRLPDEVVISDDCSTDKTIEVVERFAKRANFQVIFSNNLQNIGSSKNFENAISRCSGDLIFLSDQDDYWFPKKIEKITREFENNPTVGLVFTDAELVDENLVPLNRKLCEFTFKPNYKNANFLQLMLKTHIVTGATMAFRRDFVPKIVPIPIHIPDLIHDAWIALVIAANADVKFLDEPLIKYRQHDRQQLGIIKGNTNSLDKSIAYHQTEIERLRSLAEYIKHIHFFNGKVTKDLIESIIAEKLDLISHYSARMTLPKNKILRMNAILTELKTGRYSRFSNGWKSALKDFI